MKILKEGTPATAVISCPSCKCEMEYTNKDMQEDYKNLYNQLTTITRRDYYITCPCCGERIPVEKL